VRRPRRIVRGVRRVRSLHHAALVRPAGAPDPDPVLVIILVVAPSKRGGGMKRHDLYAARDVAQQVELGSKV